MATHQRISSSLGLIDIKKDNTIEEQEVETERRKKRRLSQIVGISATEETIESAFVVSKGEEKRSRWFSQLFPRRSTSSDVSLSRKEARKTEEETGVLTMAFQLFVRPLRQTTKHKSNSSFEAVPRNKATKKDRIKITINIRPFWRPRRDHSSEYAESDPLSVTRSISLTPTVVRRSLITQKERRYSACDSKFSSTSSTISFTSLSHELISLTAAQRIILLHLTRKVKCSLQAQERLTTKLSTNLAFLFARKERLIIGNTRVSKLLCRMLLQMMRGLRELVGRSFLKKAAFLHRSLQLVDDLADILEHGPGYRMQEVNDSDTTLIPLPHIDAGNRLSAAVSEINVSELSLAFSPPGQQIDIYHFHYTLLLLREDAGVQRQLDEALRAGIVGPCEDLRIPATVNERIALKRFVGFLDTCLASLSQRYVQEGKVIKALDILGNILRGDEYV